ncbi:hypothetical protein SAMN04487989_10115 [Bizionia echini]|uniref:Lipoprotein n=1 Tax=Bizionia echini TaxID=649333 RepID=A0A1I4YHT5_9FLAO|nr:hypothetical protein [Bizionia echini]SFN37601.1 hypothetical protein SAMN04487989_10115 [Bizionia echini]
MKNITLIVIILILGTSCQNQKIAELNNQITELEDLNTELTDSLNRYDYLKVISSELIGIPDNTNLVPNQPNKFIFLLPTIQKFPEYNVYRITKNGNEEVRELLYENYKESRFEFNFIPKNENDKSFELLAEFDLDSIKVQIPGIIDMTLTE